MTRPYLGTIGQLLDTLSREQPRTHSYAHLSSMGPARWSAEARSVLLNRLDFAPDRVPLEAQTLARTKADGYVRETVEFASTRHHRIRGELLLPNALRKPLPAVLALHDHGGFFTHGREKIVEGMSDSPALVDFVKHAYEGCFWASELARRGYVVFVTDVLGWGERRQTVDDLPPVVQEKLATYEEDSHEWVSTFNSHAAQAAPVIDQHAYFAGLSWMGLVVWDDLRAMDYLLSRPEVATERIACAGLSGGGWRSTYLLGADERLAAGAIIGWMDRLRTQLLHPNRNHIGLYTAPSVYSALDHPDIAAIAAPRPLLVIQCEQDSLFDPNSMRQACEDIRQVYEDTGFSMHFCVRFYNQPHCFNREMQEEMFGWLSRWL